MSAKRKASSSSPRPPPRLPSVGILLIGILLLALAIRMLPAIYSICGGLVHFTGLDSYYHMRRIVYTVYHFPSTSVFDSYVNYPAGFPIYWPPLFDQVAAGLSLLAGLGHPGPSTIELTSAMVPALIGVLSIVPLYYLAKDAMGKHVALIAALAMAIIPGSVYQSLFGGVDHHGMEVLLSLTTFLLFTRAVSSARSEALDIRNLTEHKTPLAYAALAGLATASMVFTWDGAPIFIGVIVLYALMQYAYDAYNKEHSTYLTIAGSATALVALVLVAPLAATGAGGAGFQVTAITISWFHILLLLAVLAFFLFMGTSSVMLARRSAPWYALPAAAIVLAGIVVLIAKLAMPAFLNGIGAGITFLVGGNRILSTVEEIQPLLSDKGHFSLFTPWAFFSMAMLLSILGLLWFLITMRGRRLKHVEIFLLVWTVFAIVLGLMQKRFIYLLAVNVALFTAYALYKVLDLAGLEQYLARLSSAPDTPHKQGVRGQRSRSASISPALAFMIMVAILLMIPLMINSVGMALTPEPYLNDWTDACIWVKNNTPPTSDLYSADAGTHPEYGIMNWWDYGNYILYRAERPAIANNFQTGIDNASAFFIAQNETAADEIMDRTGARYVMLDRRMGSPYAGISDGIFEIMPYLAGDDPASYHMRNNASRATMSPKYNSTMYSRLYDLDGCDGLEHYRLICATSGADPVKVFQHVKGARITGNAVPGAKVDLSVPLLLPDGERTYHSTTVADGAGAYAFTVPYPASGYTISTGGRQYAAAVPEDAVIGGTAITISA